LINTPSSICFYPNLSIKNKLYPKHLDQTFCTIYEEIYNERREAKSKSKANKKDKISAAVDGGLKLSLNSIFGKSNSQYSIVYDPLYTASITINGQLLLSLLAEKLSVFSQVFYLNTDARCRCDSSVCQPLVFSALKHSKLLLFLALR